MASRLERLGRAVSRWPRAHPILVIVTGCALVAATGLPAQLAYRSADGHGDDVRLAAQLVAAHSRPGDAVLYQPAWWRQLAAAYPYGFARLRDVSLAQTPAQAGNFTGVQLPLTRLRARLRDTRRVWLVEFLVFRPDPALGPDWTVLHRWRPSPFVLTLYARKPGSPR